MSKPDRERALCGCGTPLVADKQLHLSCGTINCGMTPNWLEAQTGARDVGATLWCHVSDNSVWLYFSD